MNGIILAISSNVQDWSPHMSFILKGYQISTFSVERLVHIQDVNPRTHKWNRKLILNLCMNYMVHVSSTMWRIKNQPSNSISCSDNAPRLLILVACILCRGLHQLTSSFSNWGCVSKGCFERGVRTKSRLKSIEDFNLEHWLAGVTLWDLFASSLGPSQKKCMWH